MRPKVIIGYSACPLTRRAFETAGCDAYTCDLLPSRGDAHDQQNHLHGDVWQYLNRDWDAAVLHPMCTYLTCSAAWAFKDADFDRYPVTGYHQKIKPGTLVGSARREARAAAIANFERLLALPYPVAIENPAPSFLSRAVRAPDQTVQPYEFGDDASKRTGLWLNGLPKLIRTKRVAGRLLINGTERWSNQTDSGQNRLTPGKGRWLERSKTYPGIAAAMGAQWGGFLRGK